MNATEFIDRLNEGRTLICKETGTIIYQDNDRVSIQTPVVLLNETPKISAWAISERGNVQMFNAKGKCLLIIRPESFEGEE